MNGQKWYQKATVQSSLVNAIPSVAMALIAIVAMLSSNRNLKSQLNFIEKQYVRDSISDVRQMQVQKTKLNSVIWGTLQNIPYGSYDQIYENVVLLSKEEKVSLLNFVINNLMSEIENPYLVNNEHFRYKWENIIWQCRMNRRFSSYDNKWFSGSLFNVTTDLLDIESELTMNIRRIKVTEDSSIFINVLTGDTIE